MLKTMLKCSAAVAVATTAFAGHSVSIAQEEERAGRDTITVTARKREESILDIPAAVDVIDEQTIETLRVDDVDAIINLSANVNSIASPDTGQIAIRIRGVADPTVRSDIDPSVALYRNGFYISTSGVRPGQLVDLNRLEILKGPQGGLFGRNATGGMVNFVFNEPDTSEASYRLEGTYANFDRYEVNGVANMPLSENIALRVAGWWTGQDDSEQFNTFLNEPAGRLRDYGVRASVLFDLGGGIENVTMFEFNEREEGGLTTTINTGLDNGTGLPGSNVDISGFATTGDFVSFNTPQRRNGEFIFVSNKTDVDLGSAGALQLAVSYNTVDTTSTSDFDKTSADAAVTGFADSDINYIQDSETVFTELRYFSPAENRLRGQAGVSFLYNEFTDQITNPTFLDIDDGLEAFLASLGGTGVEGVILGGLENETNQSVRSIAGYGQIEFDVFENLTVGGAVRYTNDRRKGDLRQELTGSVNAQLAFGFLVPSVELDGLDETFDDVTYEADIKYAVSDSVTVYARTASAFRAGGLNAVAPNAEIAPFQPESATAYEGGFKMAGLLDGTLGFNGAVYYQETEDALLFADLLNTGFTSAINGGVLDTLGFELDATYQPFEYLSLRGAVGYNDAELSELSPEVQSVLPDVEVGSRPPGIPEWTVSAQAFVNYPISNDIEGIFTANLRHESGENVGARLVEIPGGNITTLDISAGVVINDRFTILGFADNVTDDRNLVFVSGLGNLVAGGTSERISAPRTYGINVIAEF